MKKNWTMRVGVLLLALTLITSCFVGGTFAKYVTDGTGKDTARVAKFGVTVEATNDSAFKTQYTKDTTDENVTFTYTVESGNADKLVAPGTKGDVTDVVLSGTPEVAVNVKYEATEFKLDNWKIGDDEYCPLIFTVEDEKYFIDGENINTVEELENAVKQAISDCSANYAANTNLSTIGKDAPTVSWEWEFEGATVPGQTDEKDTALGDKAADTEDAANAATITLTIKTTVTQID